MARHQATVRELRVRIAVNVARLRAVRGLSQQRAAELLDMPVRVLQRVENGETNVTIDTIAKFASGYKVDVAELVAPTAAPLKSRRVGRPKTKL